MWNITELYLPWGGGGQFATDTNISCVWMKSQQQFLFKLSDSCIGRWDDIPGLYKLTAVITRSLPSLSRSAFYSTCRRVVLLIFFVQRVFYIRRSESFLFRGQWADNTVSGISGDFQCRRQTEQCCVPYLNLLNFASHADTCHRTRSGNCWQMQPVLS